LKWVEALASNAPYPSAPVSPSFWDDRVNDLSFEKPAGTGSSRRRHEVRLWHTDFRTPDGAIVFVGTAVLDAGLKWGLFYRIGPDVDAERDAVGHDLTAAGVAASVQLHGFVPPLEGRNTFGDPYFTDGRIAVIRLETR
ncbi:MAG: LssY C-terminal domain-containing protein, partial [Verrucomicrobiota bacterium]